MAIIDAIIKDVLPCQERGDGINVGSCPFCKNTKKSFYIFNGKCMCISCKYETTDPIGFLAKFDNVTPFAAAEYIAQTYGGGQITQIAPQITGNNAELFEANRFAADYFQKRLLENTKALAYLEERGFSKDIIEKFKIGFSDNTLYTKKNSPLFYKLGLLHENSSDFFKDRITIPIFNEIGQIVGFSGRIINGNSNTAKYKNSPETALYSKSNCLYGINFARPFIVKGRYCIITEGYFDVITLHQNNIKNVVATSGTSLTEAQAKIIARYCQNCLLLFDGDEAGITAAMRNAGVLIAAGLNVNICILPDNNDPDSYMRKVGQKAFEQYLKCHTSEFVLFKLKKELDGITDPIIRGRKINDTLKILNKSHIHQVSEITGIPEKIIIKSLAKK